MVYSTCTFAPEENEQAVAAFLETHPDFTMEKAEAPWFTPAGEGAFRLLPHKLLGEGHFAAVMRREGNAEREEPAPGQSEKLPKEWMEFAKDLGIRLPAGQALTFGQSLYWAPEGMPQLRGLKVERPGLELGIAKKGRFEPAHALALWLRGCARQQDFSAESPEIAAYMHGDVVPTKEKGWCLVTVDGYSIGWGKGAENVLKNHYPKGLRR